MRRIHRNRPTLPISPAAFLAFWGCAVVLVLALPLIVLAGIFLLVLVASAVDAVDEALAARVPVTVVERAWTREIQVVRWARVTRQGPCSSVPDEAENVRRAGIPAVGRMPHHRHGRRHDHGPSTPHHSPRCSYEILDWDPVEPRVARGTTEPRRWPQAPPSGACRIPSLGCERESGRTETLTLDLDAPDRARAECPVAESLWTSTRVGDGMWLPFGALWGKPRCDGLSRGP